MVAVSCPLFFLTSLFEKPESQIEFSLRVTKRLVILTGAALVIALAAAGFLAVRATAANNTLKWALIGRPADIFTEIEADSWRVDQHFNRSLSAGERKSAVERIEASGALHDAVSPQSIEQVQPSPLTIRNVRRIPGKIVCLVESNIDLKYGIFLLTAANDSSVVFYRKGINWSAGQAYMLIFNTGDLDKNISRYALSLKQSVDTFTLEHSLPIGSLTF